MCIIFFIMKHPHTGVLFNHINYRMPAGGLRKPTKLKLAKKGDQEERPPSPPPYVPLTGVVWPLPDHTAGLDEPGDVDLFGLETQDHSNDAILSASAADATEAIRKLREFDATVEAKKMQAAENKSNKKNMDKKMASEEGEPTTKTTKKTGAKDKGKFPDPENEDEFPSTQYKGHKVQKKKVSDDVDEFQVTTMQPPKKDKQKGRKAQQKKVNEESDDANTDDDPEYDVGDEAADSDGDDDKLKKKAKGKKQKVGKTKENRYEHLRILAKGIIEADKGENQKIRKRQEILRMYEVPMPDGSPTTTDRVQYGKCYIDKDDEMQELTGCEIGLVRGMDSICAFIEEFKAEGWDAQMSGLCTIHVTQEVRAIMNQMSRKEQDAWLRLPATLLKYDHYIIDGAHRVEIGIGEFGALASGCFGLIHPSIPFELREKLAISSNTISEIVNKTTLRDKLLFMAKQLQYKRTIPQICHTLDGAWGDVGAMSLLRQVVTRLDRPCWDALNKDYGSVGNRKKNEPMFGQTLMLMPIFKTIPQHLRGIIMQDMVAKTMDGTTYVGCSSSSQKPKGREQALWIASIKATCLAELSLHTKSKLQVVKAQDAEENAELQKRFKGDDIHLVIAKEIGISDSKDWTAPLHLQKKVNVQTAQKAVNNIVHKILGEPMFKAHIEVIKETAEKDEKEKDEEDVSEEFREFRVEAIQGPHFLQGDATQGGTWNRIKEHITDIKSGCDVTRVMLVFSPPWGVLAEKTKEGMEDAEITPSQISEVIRTMP